MESILGLKYLSDIDDPIQMAIVVLLLALAPAIATALTCLSLRSVTWRSTRRRIPLVGRFLPRKLAILIGGFVGAVVVNVELLLLGELLTLPFGTAVGLFAIALGITAGMWARARATRNLKVLSGVMLLGTVVVVLLFSGQFTAQAPGSASPEGPFATGPAESQRPPQQQPTAPAPLPTAPATDGTIPTALPSPTVAGSVETGTVVLAGRRYSTSTICVEDHGNRPVAVGIDAANRVSVVNGDGLRIANVAASNLLACDSTTPEVHSAPGKTLHELSGDLYPLTAETPVAVIAVVEDEAGKASALVWRKDQGVLHVGLVALGDLSDTPVN